MKKPVICLLAAGMWLMIQPTPGKAAGADPTSPGMQLSHEKSGDAAAYLRVVASPFSKISGGETGSGWSAGVEYGLPAGWLNRRSSLDFFGDKYWTLNGGWADYEETNGYWFEAGLGGTRSVNNFFLNNSKMGLGLGWGLGLGYHRLGGYELDRHSGNCTDPKEFGAAGRAGLGFSLGPRLLFHNSPFSFGFGYRGTLFMGDFPDGGKMKNELGLDGSFRF